MAVLVTGHYGGRHGWLNPSLTRSWPPSAERTARGVAAAVSRLVTSGALPAGTRLPTVRALAGRLGISPTTVSEAWQSLAQAGAIEARGRLGTFVLDATRPQGPRRYRRLTAAGRAVTTTSPSTSRRGRPTPTCCPTSVPVLARVARHDLTTSYLDDPVLPALEATLRAAVAVPARGAHRRGRGHGRPRPDQHPARAPRRPGAGGEPGFPPLLDLLEQLGAETVGLPLDEQGIVPDALRDALALQPVALFLQPRAQNPTGVSMTPAGPAAWPASWRAPTCSWSRTTTPGDIAASEPVSLGAHLPDRTVHILSFSKSHGPDLRLAAVGGPGRVIARVADRRLLGPGWSSRLLQAVLVELLHDPATEDTIERARAVYAERRKRLVAALEGRGVTTTGTDGINLWVEVADEQSALVALAARGHRRRAGQPVRGGRPRRRPHPGDGQPRPRRARGHRGADRHRRRPPDVVGPPAVTRMARSVPRSGC